MGSERCKRDRPPPPPPAGSGWAGEPSAVVAIQMGDLPVPPTSSGFSPRAVPSWRRRPHRPGCRTPPPPGSRVRPPRTPLGGGRLHGAKRPGVVARSVGDYSSVLFNISR
mgnify:CR=1 FL=1